MVLTTIGEEYERSRRFDQSEGSSPELRERLSDYVRLEDPREITTAGNHTPKRRRYRNCQRVHRRQDRD